MTGFNTKHKSSSIIWSLAVVVKLTVSNNLESEDIDMLVHHRYSQDLSYRIYSKFWDIGTWTNNTNPPETAPVQPVIFRKLTRYSNGLIQILNWHASVAQLDACPSGNQEVLGIKVLGLIPAQSGNILSLRMIIRDFLVILLLLLLVQEGQLSVSGIRMCTSTG